MTRSTRWSTRVVVVSVVAVVAAAAAGVGAWLLVAPTGPSLPQISAYSHNHMVRVGPYQYCDVINLNACDDPRHQGELGVNEHDPVQLSVPVAIGGAPWRLVRVYEDELNSTATLYRPHTRLAVTIPTVDPQRGRLIGIAVQLLTLVIDETGQLYDTPHAEWSVRMVWSAPPGQT